MKAILVIEMPEVCGVCPLCQPDNERNMCYCGKTMADIKLAEKPDWCPLRPMPLKRRSYVLWGTDPKELDYKTAKFISTHEVTEYDKGWNDCVEFLEGEENE